jgi:hypothetical protein
MRWLSLLLVFVCGGVASAQGQVSWVLEPGETGVSIWDGTTYTPNLTATNFTFDNVPDGTWVSISAAGAGAGGRQIFGGQMLGGQFNSATWGLGSGVTLGGAYFGLPDLDFGGGSGWPDGIPQILEADSILEAVTGVVTLLAPLFVLFAIGLAACYLIWRFAFGKVAA